MLSLFRAARLRVALLVKTDALTILEAKEMNRRALFDSAPRIH
jgi:hypothetical protein